MKKPIVFIILIVLNYNLYSQINPRMYNINYTYTVFDDQFYETSIDESKWRPGMGHRGIGKLIYSPLTHNVRYGKLELTMQYIPDYSEYSDFLGAEFSSDATFLYGIFECEASFANGVSSWPAFWAMHQLPCPDNEGPEM